MEEIRIKLPEELNFLRQMPNIEWSILVNKLIKVKLEELARLERGLSKSKLTEKDVEEFSDKINETLSKRYLKG